MKLKRGLLVLPMVLAIFGTTSCENESTGGLVTISKETVSDKVLGGWVGHNIGMGSGYEYVVTNNDWCVDGKIEGITVPGKTAIFALADKYWEPYGRICSGSIGCNAMQLPPINDPRVISQTVYSDDDNHVDLLNQFIFRDYGPKLGNSDIANAWKFYAVSDVGGGQYTASLVNNSNYISPFCGTPTYGNSNYFITESWIENETLGLTFPYMYDTALAYSDMFTQVQGDAYAYYLGKLCSMMYALAYEYNDAPTCLEKAWDFIPQENELYYTYELVKQCYKQNIPWRDCAREVVEQSVNCAKISMADMAGFSITANAGMIFLGIVYGENDFEKSIKITSLAGLDGDCTAATVGGLLGACLGYSQLPQKYKDFLGPDSIFYNHTGSNGYATGVSWGAFAYMGRNFPNSLKFSDIIDIFIDNIESQIICNGGKINNGNYQIRSQGYHPVEQIAVTNFSFENGNIEGWEVNPSTTEFSASKSACHIGTYGGLAVLADPTDTVKIYHKLNLTKGNTYKATIWVNKCNDREFKMFASDIDGKNLKFRSYVNTVSNSNRHMKAELYFTATSDEMIVGVDYCKTYEDAYSTTICIDDLIVSDITRTVSKNNKQEIEFESAKLLYGAKKITNEKYSDKSAVKLGTDDGVRINFKGDDEVQAFKIYYENTSLSYGFVNIIIDGYESNSFHIPVAGTGLNSSYNSSNYVKFEIYVGSGNHEMQIDYFSFDDLVLDKIEIVNANKLLESK